MKLHKQIDLLLKGGVIIPDPASVYVDEDVDVSKIAEGVVLYPGTRISGSNTSIGPDSEIGGETPATVDSCQLGRNVRLKGGYFSRSVFFDGASMGSSSHVRAGTILEEEANGAHSVGLKQTILMPYVTLGSLINFCDALMAGGTDRQNHSEVGSSYIHFNYTPHQDKATASLIGDVARGVFLNQKPVFLGGQGGLVGPARIAYGTIVAAGGTCRQSIFEENQLHVPKSLSETTRPYETGTYRQITSILKNNLYYIGSIAALKEWYVCVRKKAMHRDPFDIACCDGGLLNLDIIMSERIRRLDDLAAKLEVSYKRLAQEETAPAMVAEQKAFAEEWPAIQFELKQGDWAENTEAKEQFLAAFETIPVGGSYTDIIKSLRPDDCQIGQRWLQSIVDGVSSLWPPK